MRDCKQCFNLRAVIPIRPNGRMVFSEVNGFCREGQLLNINNETKIFKNILRKDNNLDSFKYAERCAYFDGEDWE